MAPMLARKKAMLNAYRSRPYNKSETLIVYRVLCKKLAKQEYEHLLLRTHQILDIKFKGFASWV